MKRTLLLLLFAVLILVALIQLIAAFAKPGTVELFVRLAIAGAIGLFVINSARKRRQNKDSEKRTKE